MGPVGEGSAAPQQSTTYDPDAGWKLGQGYGLPENLKTTSDSTHEYKPQGERDRVAEQMMIRFSESGHPVFRNTNPLSRETLKSKGCGKLSIHFCADGDTVETVFRTIISEQSQICVQNVKPAMLERGDVLWQDNLAHCLCPL